MCIILHFIDCFTGYHKCHIISLYYNVCIVTGDETYELLVYFEHLVIFVMLNRLTFVIFISEFCFHCCCCCCCYYCCHHCCFDQGICLLSAVALICVATLLFVYMQLWGCSRLWNTFGSRYFDVHVCMFMCVFCVFFILVFFCNTHWSLEFFCICMHACVCVCVCVYVCVK
jgi:hypothetical protein